MSTTVAELINKKSNELIQYISQPFKPVDNKLSLESQARKLIENDEGKLVRLGKNFKIPKQAELEPHLRDVKFNSFLAESLLREGSLLLDRCLQQRSEYDQLSTKWFEACIQVDELIRLNDIMKREEKDYDKSIGIAQSEKNALVEENTQLAILEQKFEKVASYASEVNEKTSPQAKAMGNTDAQKEYLFRADLSRYSMEGIQAATGIQQQEMIIKTNAEKLAGIEINIELKKSQTAFQIERNEIARTVALRRAEQIRIEGGALNFWEQMKPVKDRFNNDLKAAWFRLSSAMRGFSELYQHQYPADLPKDLYDITIDFDELVTWCQHTNTWLASFVDTQQQVTRSFSLEQLLSEQGKKFKDGLAKGKWQFKLGEDHFYNSKFVRLRSFAVQIDSGEFSGNWNIAITPPTQVIFRNESTKPDENPAKLTQNVGRLYLGRVNETTYQVIPESAAPPKLYNASPIGQDIDGGEWTIEILGMSTNKIPVTAIKDIDIHLTVALV